jgi:hypothetical protein
MTTGREEGYFLTAKYQWASRGEALAKKETAIGSMRDDKKRIVHNCLRVGKKNNFVLFRQTYLHINLHALDM